MDKKAPATIAAQALGWIDEETRAVSPGLHVSSTYVRDVDNGYRSGRIYARADNIFDNRYATYGTFFDTNAVPNFANGGAQFTDARSVSPARPRAYYVGLKATF